MCHWCLGGHQTSSYCIMLVPSVSCYPIQTAEAYVKVWTYTSDNSVSSSSHLLARIAWLWSNGSSQSNPEVHISYSRILSWITYGAINPTGSNNMDANFALSGLELLIWWIHSVSGNIYSSQPLHPKRFNRRQNLDLVLQSCLLQMSSQVVVLHSLLESHL